jgi:hypothetical protein
VNERSVKVFFVNTLIIKAVAKGTKHTLTHVDKHISKIKARHLSQDTGGVSYAAAKVIVLSPKVWPATLQTVTSIQLTKMGEKITSTKDFKRYL